MTFEFMRGGARGALPGEGEISCENSRVNLWPREQ